MLCLVTDRRRICPGCAPDRSRQCMVEHVRFAIEAGIDLVQIRERDLEALAKILRKIVPEDRSRP